MDERDELEQLRAANETMREFVATAAHELRGPTAAILGFAQTMLSRWDSIEDADKQEYLGIIIRRSRYLTRLLDSLLTLSKIEANALDVKPKEIVIREAIGHAIEDLGEQVRGVEVEAAPDLAIVADPDHVRRILVNYLSNAFKYGEPPVRVRVDVDGDRVTVAVADDGEGIAEDLVDRLFDRFARSAQADGEKGTGLGLSIVRGLARANGGDAWYEPNEPQGSRFAVWFPRSA